MHLLASFRCYQHRLGILKTDEIDFSLGDQLN